jgi:signal transduction histidine kinase
MRALLESSVATVQRIASELRPALLDNLGLIAAIEWLTRDCQEHTGISVVFTHAGDQAAEQLEGSLATALFRICQEALTNVVRHAQAGEVCVCLDVSAGQVLLEIKDDGIGIAPAQVHDPRSFGLLGMRERLHPWGGRLTIAGGPGQGTTVAAVVPYTKTGHLP